MSKIAATASVPSIQGFRFNHEATLTENATAAWEAQKEVTRRQLEQNARVLARKVFHTDELAFAYHEKLYPEIPTFDVDDELIAYRPDNRCFALIEICFGCEMVWKWNDFSSLSGLGKQLALVAARDPFTCQQCQALEHLGKKKKS